MDPSVLQYLSSFAMLQHAGMSESTIKALTDGLAAQIAKDIDDQVVEALLNEAASCLPKTEPSLVDLINDIFPDSEIE